MTCNQSRSGSFAWLNATQFLGALNDNLFKLLLIFLLVEIAGAEHRAEILALASTVFVLPFLLFSHAAGVLADRLSKRDIIVAAKWLELLIMALGCAAVRWPSAWKLYGVLFLMCSQSALFGPSKYGIIPEIVPEERLSRANGLLVGLSYLAIILGTFIPSWLLLKFFQGHFFSLALVCLGVAAAGVAASYGIARTPAQRSTKRFTPWFFVDVFRTLFDIRRDPPRILSFGHGIHACIGQHFARLEGRLCLAKVLAHMPEYEVDEPRLRRIFGRELAYAGRDASASPAVGSLALHRLEHERLIADALGPV